MVALAAGDWIGYNVHIKAEGRYTFRVRVGGPPGTLDILNGGELWASVAVGGGGWKTVSHDVSLPAGVSTLRLRCGTKDQVLNWLEVAPRAD